MGLVSGSPPPLSDDAIERLRQALDLSDRVTSTPTAPTVPGAPAAEPRPGARQLAGRVARRVLRPLWDRVLTDLSPRVTARLKDEVTARVTDDVGVVRTDVASLTAEVRSLAGLSRLTAASADLAQIAADARPITEELQRLTVNVELLKGELRAYSQVLDDIGFAIAPGAGLVGIADRFAELRAQVNALDGRMRSLGRGAPAATEAIAPAAPVDPAPARPTSEATFDYSGFERRFRGEADAVVQTLLDRYLDVLQSRGPVLDIGCGRGELVQALTVAGIAATGVDLNDDMVAEGRAQGRDLHLGDAVAYLREQPPASFGAITAMQVVEHLELPVLLECLELVASRLRPGGLLIAETPNPSSLIVLGNSYILDPTHVWPLHPSLLTFLCERAGFVDVRQRFFEPAEAYRLPPLEGGDDDPPWLESLNRSLERLNDVLFGPQDYAVLARVAG